MSEAALPLFPLSLVLFPGGRLDLRIFEPRYLDLVRLCTRENRPFGVCAALPPADDPTGTLTPARIGTLARIVDFHTRADGLLGIRCRGEQRFRAGPLRVRDNGLLVTDPSLLDDDIQALVRPEHSLLAQLLDNVLDQAGGEHADAERELRQRAAWVGFRLAELLPLALAQRQTLLQCADPHQRLQHLVDWLPELIEAGESDEG